MGRFKKELKCLSQGGHASFFFKLEFCQVTLNGLSHSVGLFWLLFGNQGPLKSAGAFPLTSAAVGLDPQGTQACYCLLQVIRNHLTYETIWVQTCVWGLLTIEGSLCVIPIDCLSVTWLVCTFLAELNSQRLLCWSDCITTGFWVTPSSKCIF